MPEPQPPVSGLRDRALAGAARIAGATWLVRLLSVVTFVFVGRQLTPSAFGLVALANAFVLLLGIVTESGFATYLVRSPSLDRRVFSTAFWTAAAVAVVLAGGLVAAAPLLATAFSEPALADVLRVLAAVVLINGLASAPAALLRRELRFAQLATRSIVSSVVASVVAIALAAVGAGVWALVWQALVSALVSAVLVWLLSPWRPSMSFARAEVRPILTFGGQLLLTDLLLQARDRGEEFTLGLVGNATLLGQWSVASRIVKLGVDSATQVINTVSTPALARVQHDAARLHRGYAASMAAAGALLFPTMGWLAITSTDLVPLVMGRQWASVAPVAAVIALTACLGGFTYFDRSLFAIADRLAIEIALVVVIVVLHLIATVLFAPFGLQALALALLGRTLITLPLRQWALHRWVGVPYTALLPALRTLAAAGTAVAVAAGILMLVDRLGAGVWARLGCSAGALAVVYLVCMRLWARSTFDALMSVLRAARSRAAASGARVRRLRPRS